MNWAVLKRKGPEPDGVVNGGLLEWQAHEILSGVKLTVDSAHTTINEFAELFGYNRNGDVVVHIEKFHDGKCAFDVIDGDSTIALLDCFDGEVFHKEVYNGAGDFVVNLEKFGVFRKIVEMIDR